MTVRHPSRRRSVIALVILVVIVTAMAIIIRNTGTRQPLTDPTAAPTPVLPPNPTLLVQLRDDGLTNVDSVVMGLDTADRRGSSWYLPQNLVVDLVGGRDETLGLTGFKPTARRVRATTTSERASLRRVLVHQLTALPGPAQRPRPCGDHTSSVPHPRRQVEDQAPIRLPDHIACSVWDSA